MRSKESGRVGEVLEVGWESDEYDFEEEDEEDQRELWEHEIRVAWQGTDQHQILPLDEVDLSDKTFSRGCLVAPLSSPTQCGVITNASIFVDVHVRPSFFL